jgi:hypothetical protein
MVFASQTKLGLETRIMRKTFVLLLVLLVLAAVYGLFVYKQAPDNEFHIPDAKMVHRVVLEKVVKGVSTRKLSLEKAGENSWTIDGKQVALQRKVDDFLIMLTQIRVQKPVETEGMSSAMALLKRNHTLVEIFDQEGEVIKSYLVGATNHQQTTNIMMIKGANKAWYVGRPGHTGYVSIMYTTDPLDWRELLLWELEGRNLQSISAQYGLVADGFELARKGVEGQWLFQDGTAVDPAHMDDYLKLFKGKLFAESLAEISNPGILDSLTKRAPDVVFSFRDLKGQGDALKLFIRPENPNNYFGYMESQKEAYTVQHHVIDAFLKTKGYFLAKPI